MAMIHPANFKGLGADGFDTTILLFEMLQRCNFGTLLRINRLGLRQKRPNCRRRCPIHRPQVNRRSIINLVSR
jgi:hypothetical protein